MSASIDILTSYYLMVAHDTIFPVLVSPSILPSPVCKQFPFSNSKRLARHNFLQVICYNSYHVVLVFHNLPLSAYCSMIISSTVVFGIGNDFLSYLVKTKYMNPLQLQILVILFSIVFTPYIGIAIICIIFLRCDLT